jgi:hypothetical protein
VIGRIGSAAAAGLGAVLFGVGVAWFAVVLGLEPNMTAAIAGMMVLGIAVELAFPTLTGAGTAGSPASSYATGAGVLNMVRQTALALGVAIAIAVLGTPQIAVDQLAAFRNVWWFSAGFALVSVLPVFLLTQPTPLPVAAGNRSD